MVSSLIFNLLLILTLFKAESCSHKWGMENHVDFIESEPVLNQTFKACEKGTAKIFIEAKHLTITPSSILGNQVHWTIKVRDRYQWFNTIFMALIEEILIEFQAVFIWFLFVPFWKNTTPSNGQTIGFKAHFSK